MMAENVDSLCDSSARPHSVTDPYSCFCATSMTAVLITFLLLKTVFG